MMMAKYSNINDYADKLFTVQQTLMTVINNYK